MTKPGRSLSEADWQAKLHASQVSKSDLDRLVLDYLVVQGHKNAAEQFCREMQTSPDGHALTPDFHAIQSRTDVRNLIQRGQIEQAIERINDLNPQILDTNPLLYFHLLQQHLIELIRVGNLSEALFFASSELAPRGEDHPAILSELERTMALLAFDVPNAPSSVPPGLQSLLDVRQRLTTAREVNEALLMSVDERSKPALPGLVRMLSWGENMLGSKMIFPNLNMAELLGKAKLAPGSHHLPTESAASEQKDPPLVSAGDDQDMTMEL